MARKLLPIFMSKALLEHRHSHLHTDSVCFHIIMTELSRCDRLHSSKSLKYLLPGSLRRKLLTPPTGAAVGWIEDGFKVLDTPHIEK